MKTNPEINMLKHRIRELEERTIRYKAREEQLIGMMQRIVDISEEAEIV